MRPRGEAATCTVQDPRTDRTDRSTLPRSSGRWTEVDRGGQKWEPEWPIVGGSNTQDVQAVAPSMSTFPHLTTLCLSLSILVDLGYDLFRGFLAAVVVDNDGRAVLSETSGDGGADTTRSTRDDGYLLLERQRHRYSRRVMELVEALVNLTGSDI